MAILAATFSLWLPTNVELLSLLSKHAFAVLACLPGFIGLFRSFWEKRSFDKATREIDKAANKSEKKAAAAGRRASPGFEKDVSEQRPSWWMRILSVTCLTAVFAVVAAVGGDNQGSIDLGVDRVKQPSVASGPAAPARASGPSGYAASGATAPSGPSSSGAAAPNGPSSGESSARAAVGAPSGQTGASRSTTPDGTKAEAQKGEPPRVSGLAGLVYAGYGAYVYTMLLIISRLNSKALTSMFFMVSAVRSAIALVLGFVAADTNLFSGLSPNQGLFVLFFIGLFPSMAMDAIRQRAQLLFKPSTPGCDVLPLCLIDGIDDGIADRLAEIGIWDVEHIATADAFKLTAQTLYPLRRVIDWMDQALLIGYVRANVAHFRACGVRGAMDFAALYRDAMKLKTDPTQQAYLTCLTDRAQKLVQALAQKTNLQEPTIYTIGRNVYEDAVVNFIWNLWFDDENDQEAGGDQDKEPPSSPGSTPGGTGSPPGSAPSSTSAPPVDTPRTAPAPAGAAPAVPSPGGASPAGLMGSSPGS
ncbi:MAG TPA: hypothetical protein VN999_10275 [Thermoanaerobaculia bacterium]|nr:hypothetical protein [Thermoanaerobaculia bacterium]